MYLSSLVHTEKRVEMIIFERRGEVEKEGESERERLFVTSLRAVCAVCFSCDVECQVSLESEMRRSLQATATRVKGNVFPLIDD